MRDDLGHSPIAYYFHPGGHRRHALPLLLPDLIAMVDACSGPRSRSPLRLQASMLRQAINDLLETIAEDFLSALQPADGAAEALAGYRRDHHWASS